MTEPPVPIEIREIKFTDDTHFLDHRIGGRYCRSLNSTGRKAIKLHWQYLRDFKHTWDQRLVHRLMCWLGYHDWQNWQRTGEPVRVVCEWCGDR